MWIGNYICRLLTVVSLSGSKVEEQDGKELKQSTSKAGTKRKKDVGGDQKSKVAKADGDVSKIRGASVRKNNDAEDQNPKSSDLECKLEVQTKKLWALKDELKQHVTTAELREMLEANGQDPTGSEFDLREQW